MKRLMLLVLLVLCAWSIACRGKSACEDNVQVVTEYLDDRLLLMLHAIEAARCTSDELYERPCVDDFRCWDGRKKVGLAKLEVTGLLSALLKALPDYDFSELRRAAESIDDVQRQKLARSMTSNSLAILGRDRRLLMTVAKNCSSFVPMPQHDVWDKMSAFGEDVFFSDSNPEDAHDSSPGCERIRELIDIQRAKPLYTTLMAPEKPADEAGPDSSSLVTQ